MSIFRGRTIEIPNCPIVDFDEVKLRDVSPMETLSAIPEIDITIDGRFQLRMRDPAKMTKPGFVITPVDDFIYERAWVYPPSIDFGVITHELEYEIYFWNALRISDLTIDSISDLDAVSGITFSPEAPVTLSPTEEQLFVMTVSADSTIPIDGFKIFNTVELAYTIPLELAALRSIVFDYLHNWAKKFEIKYKFITKLFTSKKFQEQRSPKYQNALREMKIQILENKDRAYRISNMLQAGRAAVWIVPVFSEPLTLNMVGSINAVTSLTFNQDLRNYWNTYGYHEQILIYNESLQEAIVRDIDSIATYTIGLDREIDKAWDASAILVFPAVSSVIKEFKIDPITDQIVSLDIGTEEFISNG